MTSFEFHLTEGKAGTGTNPIDSECEIRSVRAIDFFAIVYPGGSLGVVTVVLLEISLLLHLGYISRKQICVFQITADGSPAGSTTGGGAIDGAQLALRMVALASQSSSSSSGGLCSGDSSQLYKLLSKPQNIDPSSREQEIAMWREWSWSFEQYLASLHSHYPDELKVIRGNLSTEIDQSVQDDKERQRGTFLYRLLSGVLKQRPLMLLKQVPNSNDAY